MLRQLLVVCNISSNRRGCFPLPDWHSHCVKVVSRADSVHCIRWPGGLPTAARVLRARRRSRGGGYAFSASLVEPPDSARTEPYGCAVAAVVLGMDVPPKADAMERAS